LKNGRVCVPSLLGKLPSLTDFASAKPTSGGIIMAGLIWGIIVVLFVLWLLGFAIHIGGGLIHLLLVVAVILLVFNLLTGRGARI